MKKTTVEQKFETYRQHLHSEAQRLATYFELYRALEERKSDRLAEMNIAPAFFGTVSSALFSAMVLWVDNLLGPRSQRSFLDLLTFVEKHLNMFAVAELQRRKGYPDGHWMLKRDAITAEVVAKDRAAIASLPALVSFRLRRDKFHAHFDKKYFTNRGRLQKDAPLKWPDLQAILNLIDTVLNRYSAAYDGNVYSLKPLNARDVDYLLDELHQLRESQARSARAQG